MMIRRLGLMVAGLVLWLFWQSCNSSSPGVEIVDICVLGGSEAGFTAAIQAAQLGNEVILIEPTGHPGGMLVEGIGKDIRFGSARVIGGIAREFYKKVEKFYGKEAQFDDPDWFSRYEPHVAEKIIEEMIAEYENLRLIRKTRIAEQNGVIKEGSKIRQIVLENGVIIKADYFIDASVEGHLLHLAGISTETIREGNSLYAETKNGIQVDNTYRQFQIQVDPYIEPGNPESGLIPTIQDEEIGAYGAPDKYIQGFCFRMCLTNHPDNMIPVAKPEDYDPGRYEIYRRYFKAGGKIFFPQANRHNQKTDLGSWHDLSANLYGENWPYPAGNYQTQDSIVEYHRSFTLGLIWFLQNDPEVDSLTRSGWADWGLPRDEFTDNGHWPRRLYIRSARRMVSDYVITEHHTRRDQPDQVNDPVAIAWWPPDTHHARRIVKDGYAYNEGFVFGGDDWRPFGISMQALIPKASECTNLISPTCPSSSYVAYGAIRIVPTFMVLGQSAGIMASLCTDKEMKVQDLEYKPLRSLLEIQQQILTIPDDWLKVITENN